MSRADLIEALERGETGREIDRNALTILDLTGKALDAYNVEAQKGARVFYNWPPISTSLDAALALAEKWTIRMTITSCESWAYISDRDEQNPRCKTFRGEADTPAAALLAALLRAQGESS